MIHSIVVANERFRWQQHLSFHNRNMKLSRIFFSFTRTIGKFQKELQCLTTSFCNILPISLPAVSHWYIGSRPGGNLISFATSVSILWVVRFVWPDSRSCFTKKCQKQNSLDQFLPQQRLVSHTSSKMFKTI